MGVGMLLALAGFAFVMSVSPGPSNFILLVSGANFGFRRSVPAVFGISAGFLSMVLAVGLGLGPILQAWPLPFAVLKVLCAAYVFWLAWKIARASPTGDAEERKPERPIGFAQAALLQLVNPKAWAVALIVTVTYTVQDRYLASLVVMIGVFALVNLPSISLWVLFGSGLRRLLRDPAKMRVFNIAMALLLLGSMALVLLG